MNNKDLFSYFIPAISDVIFVILLIVLFIKGSSMLGDGDAGYHIRTGQLILETWTIPQADPYSFITPALPWTAHEWLSEVIMALVHYQLGLTGVVLLFVLIIAITYTYLYKLLRARKGNLWHLLGIILLVISSSTFHWLARPHIFSLLFFVIWYHMLDKYQYENKNYLYFFSPHDAPLGQFTWRLHHRVDTAWRLFHRQRHLLVENKRSGTAVLFQKM